jgi:DNA-binding FadR family transcriptional regulator
VRAEPSGQALSHGVATCGDDIGHPGDCWLCCNFRIASSTLSQPADEARKKCAVAPWQDAHPVLIVDLYDKQSGRRKRPPASVEPSILEPQFMRKTSAVRSLYGHVMHELGQRIVGGKVKPGEVLPREETLAESLQVSRTALREALKVLSAKGLIESRTGVGARVLDPRHWNQLDADVLAWRCASMPTDDFVDKLVEMREVIEPAAAAAAARRRTAEQLAAIDAAFRAMDAAQTLDAWTAADLQFHDAVLHATGNELLQSLFSVIETALGTFFTLSARTAGDFKYSLPHHQKVLEAIRRKQPEVARKAMHAMIADSQANLQHSRGRARKKAKA